MDFRSYTTYLVVTVWLIYNTGHEVGKAIDTPENCVYFGSNWSLGFTIAYNCILLTLWLTTYSCYTIAVLTYGLVAIGHWVLQLHRIACADIILANHSC